MSESGTAGTAPSPSVSGMIPVRPMGGDQPRTHWRSEKRQRTLSLTHDAWNIFGELALASASNRSEVLEILLRYAKKEDLNLQQIRESLLN